MKYIFSFLAYPWLKKYTLHFFLCLMRCKSYSLSSSSMKMSQCLGVGKSQTGFFGQKFKIHRQKRLPILLGNSTKNIFNIISNEPQRWKIEDYDYIIIFGLIWKTSNYFSLFHTWKKIIGILSEMIVGLWKWVS